jgi:hypothetical protein
MVTYPEGADGGGSAAPAPADVSKTTIGGQPMLPSGARFDTTIIPLSTTQFVVVQDRRGHGRPCRRQDAGGRVTRRGHCLREAIANHDQPADAVPSAVVAL